MSNSKKFIGQVYIVYIYIWHLDNLLVVQNEKLKLINREVNNNEALQFFFFEMSQKICGNLRPQSKQTSRTHFVDTQAWQNSTQNSSLFSRMLILPWLNVYLINSD